MPKLVCEGCGEPIDEDDEVEVSMFGGHVDFNGEDWHESCLEFSDGPKYCCGMIYEDGELTCRSCGEPL